MVDRKHLVIAEVDVQAAAVTRVWVRYQFCDWN
jgi:hypothetical protein